MVRALVRVVHAEQVLGQAVGAAGQGHGARETRAGTYQGAALGLERTAAIATPGERL